MSQLCINSKAQKTMRITHLVVTSGSGTDRFVVGTNEIASIEYSADTSGTEYNIVADDGTVIQYRGNHCYTAVWEKTK